MIIDDLLQLVRHGKEEYLGTASIGQVIIAAFITRRYDLLLAGLSDPFVAWYRISPSEQKSIFLACDMSWALNGWNR